MEQHVLDIDGFHCVLTLVNLGDEVHLSKWRWEIELSRPGSAINLRYVDGDLSDATEAAQRLASELGGQA